MESELKKILFDPTVGKIITSIIGILIIVSLSKLLKKRLSKSVKDSDLKYKLRKGTSFFSYLLAIMMLSIIFSDKLGGLTVALGVAGAGIAFALQEIIVSVGGWLAISFSNFYRVGDRIQLGGNIGDVIDIGILRTTLMECRQWVAADQYTGRIVRISNSFVFKDAVYNYSADFPFLWDEITLPIKYGSSVETARNILYKSAVEVIGNYVKEAQNHWNLMLEKYRIENATVEPMVFIIANDNWIEFTLRYVVDYKQRRSTKDKLFDRILKEIDSSNGKVSIASGT
jgi:small-conductance mechanosensitive channel